MTVDAPLADLARSFRFNERLLDVETEGFEPADWDSPAGERGGNAARWILAHVTLYRRRILRKLGEGVAEEPWEAVVDQGVKTAEVSTLPQPPELRARFVAAGEALGRRLSVLTAADVERESGDFHPDGGRTVADWVRFLYFHEGYHLGQVGLIRRLRGRPGFA